MTDRQIVAAFFPDSFPKPKRPTGPKITYQETFWKIYKGRGWTESQIQEAWNRREKAEADKKAKTSHVRGSRVQRPVRPLFPSEGV